MSNKRYSFTLTVKQYNRENCTLDDMRVIYSGKTCLVAKNSKHGGLYLHKNATIIKGRFHYAAGSIRYPILIADKEVQIRVENFHSKPNIKTDQLNEQNIITVTDLIEI